MHDSTTMTMRPKGCTRFLGSPDSFAEQSFRNGLMVTDWLARSMEGGRAKFDSGVGDGRWFDWRLHQNSIFDWCIDCRMALVRLFTWIFIKIAFVIRRGTVLVPPLWPIGIQINEMRRVERNPVDLVQIEFHHPRLDQQTLENPKPIPTRPHAPTNKAWNRIDNCETICEPKSIIHSN